MSRGKKACRLIGATLLLVGVYVVSPALYSTRNALIYSDSFVLLSLEPRYEAATRGVVEKRPLFYGDYIMGQTTVNDPRIRAQLVDGLYQLKNPGEFGAACFHPRYAIRAKKGWRTIDVGICFDCWNVAFRQYGKSSGSIPMKNIAVKPLFDRTLHQAGVPQSQKQIF